MRSARASRTGLLCSRPQCAQSRTVGKMKLDRFNLNLFVAFEALSRAETLTQAAETLYVTQSALSVALRQMRENFDDELFVYSPKRKQLTPLAQSLRPRILEILTTAKATLKLKEDLARMGGAREVAVGPHGALPDTAGGSRAHDSSGRAANLVPKGSTVRASPLIRAARPRGALLPALKCGLLAEFD